MTPTISPATKYALGAAALGAAGMYWFDARHRLPGAMARTHSLIRSDDVSDEVLGERVRSALGRATSHAGAIDVSCSRGVVILRGAVLKHEHPRVMRAARSAAGVSEVHDELAAYKRPDGVSGLQNWSPTARLLACASGASLALWSLRQPPAIALVATAIGSALMARGATNMTLSRLVGGTGRRTIEAGVPARDAAVPREESVQEPWQSHVSSAAEHV